MRDLARHSGAHHLQLNHSRKHPLLQAVGQKLRSNERVRDFELARVYPEQRRHRRQLPLYPAKKSKLLKVKMQEKTEALVALIEQKKYDEEIEILEKLENHENN